MKRIFLFYLFLIAFTISCSKKESGAENKQDCGKVACNEMLQSIDVSIVDQNDEPVALDRLKVTRIMDRKDITREYNDHEWNIFRQLGRYPLVGDNDEKYIPAFKNTSLRFQGYIGDHQVVLANYIVTFGCCHIELVSGKLNLTVTR